MLALLSGAALANAMHALLAGRHALGALLDAELALRAAEVALRDGERDASEAYAALAAGAPSGTRALLWPAAGECGTGTGKGLCTPAPAVAPPWQRWLDLAVPVETAGVPAGAYTNMALPPPQPHVLQSAAPPRYVIERLAGGDGGDRAVAVGPDDRSRVRVTAVGIGRIGTVRVLVQSIFQP